MNWPFDDALVDALLAEDAPGGDLTTDGLGLEGRRGRIVFRARGAMTVAGIELAAAMLGRRGAAVTLACRSGDAVPAGAELLGGEGGAAGLHGAWKASQTLVEILSGVASAARALVDAVEAVDPNVRVACTRKTFPGGRRLQHLAVKAGGAILHRAGLSETILVFAEHRAFLPGESLTAIAERLKRRAPEKRIAIEVGDVAEARAAIEAGFDVIQLEKFSLEAVGEVAAFAWTSGARTLIAAAGGVNAANAAAYVRAGAGLIVTSAPYAAPPRDVAVTIGPAG
jgi:molybdenum transport protein